MALQKTSLEKKQASVLLVDDSESNRLHIEALLDLDGYSIDCALNGKAALELARKKEYSVVILDLGLPDIDGLEVCSELKSFSDAHVIMVTGRDSQADKIIGIQSGADDYITKPFDSLELLLRVGVVARRSLESNKKLREITVGDLSISLAGRTIHSGVSEIKLTKIEFSLFECLLIRSGVSISREELATACWGSSEWLGNGHALNVHMANMKKKMAVTESIKIEAIRGYGYRLDKIE